MTPQSPPLTRMTLLGALSEGLRWEEFLAVYGKIILHWAAHNFGLQASDAEDIRQQVLVRVWRGIHGYDPAKGRFRTWLFACTKSAALNFRSRYRSAPAQALGLNDVPARPAPSLAGLDDTVQIDVVVQRFEDEGFAVPALQNAARSVQARVQPATWKAFLLFEYFELTAKEIAPHVQLSPAAVNQAVHRVRKLLEAALDLHHQVPPHRHAP